MMFSIHSTQAISPKDDTRWGLWFGPVEHPEDFTESAGNHDLHQETGTARIFSCRNVFCFGSEEENTCGKKAFHLVEFIFLSPHHLRKENRPMFEATKNESFAEREERILRFWQSEKIFEKSLEQRRRAPYFSIYDGPPFATGLPHYGHLLAGTIKDVVPRYKTMKGYYVPRRFGWDCHGLPVENEIEKSHALSGAPAIEKFGVAKFNEECRQIVLRYAEQWKKTVDRMGRWVDFAKT